MSRVFSRGGLWALLCQWALVLSMSVAQAAPAAWEPVRKGEGREGVSTWVRPVPGLSLKAFRGVTEVPYTALAVLALIADIPNLDDWIYQCRSARQLDGLPPEQTYTRFKGIWPASDRDVLIETHVSQLDDGSILVDSVNVDGHPLDKDYVRIPGLHNSFKLTPLPGRWTRVEFDTQVDIGGMVPTWLANLVATDAPLRTLEGMHHELEDKDGYPKVKSVNDLPAYYLRGKPLVLPDVHLQANAGNP